MNELEKKFYNWLMLNYCVPIKPEKIAKDFAEMAEKDYEEKLIKADHNIHRMPHKFKHEELFHQEISELNDKIATLKKQIKKIKYLDRKEVEIAIEDIDPHLKIHWGYYFDCMVDTICSLALPSKEKIIEKLKHLKGAGFILGEVDDNIINFILGDDNG